LALRVATKRSVSSVTVVSIVWSRPSATGAQLRPVRGQVHRLAAAGELACEHQGRQIAGGQLVNRLEGDLARRLRIESTSRRYFDL